MVKKFQPNIAGMPEFDNLFADTLGTTKAIFSDGGPDDSFPLAAGAGGGSATTGAPTTVATIATLANYLINGFWQDQKPTPALPHHWASNTITYNISGLNADEQFLAQSAMNAWHDVANINFVQTSGAANITFTHNGSMQAVTNASWSGSGAMISATVNISTNWVTTDGGANDGKTGIDSYAYQTYVHEVGHALGLGHQGPYNGSAVYSSNALYANDTWQYSIMSYFSQDNYSGSSYRYVVTPQMADIYAVGSIYGAATTTRTGDTVYGFNSNAGAVFNFSAYTSAPALTIYDNGGSDTLDCSLYSDVQRIDLHAGSFSSVGGLTNNIGIALNCVIEKAIGGTGNDTLIANDMGCTLMGGAGVDTLTGGAGIDRLFGGSGVDTMTGGGGADIFVFAFGDSSASSGQHDRIIDFVSGVDRIDISAIDAISGTAALDPFRFLGTAAFDGTAGALNYFYNSTLGVTTLQGDTNGDRVADFAIDLVGNIALSAGDLINSVVIESVGATSLVRVSDNFYLNSIAGGTGPLLKQGGTAFAAGQAGTWLPIGVEKTASGYQVAWKNTAADEYSVWITDNNGNYINNAIGVVSGASTTLKSFESGLQQDLNGDGVIGTGAVSPTVIEAAGATSLVQDGANFYLNTIGGGTGPSLKQGGTAFAAGQAGTWLPIGVEKTASGYQVAWKNSVADEYSVWITDNNGNYINNAIGVVSGASTTLKSFESGLQQDLNGDGVIGTGAVSPTVIEAAGATSLVQDGANFYLNTIGGGTGPSLKQGGTAFAAGQAGTWLPIGVEKTASGYQVAWKNSVADEYSVWITDNNGNYINNAIGVVPGASTTLKSFESGLQQDLNGDGVIGTGAVSPTVIEAAGATSLVQDGANFYLNTIGGGTGPSLKQGGTAFAAGQAGTWLPIGVENTVSGYQVAWKNSVADEYSVWITDNNGNYINNAIGVVSGASTTLKSFESTFQQDLNGDGVTGVSAGSIGSAPLMASQGTEIAGFDFNFTSFLQTKSQVWVEATWGALNRESPIEHLNDALSETLRLIIDSVGDGHAISNDPFAVSAILVDPMGHFIIH